VTTTRVVLTPQIAQQSLALATHTVDANDPRINAYAAAMQRGDWIPGSRMTVFSDGKLRDGHVRCLAVCRANTQIEVVVTTCSWTMAEEALALH
jgi:hypothetical protein